MDHFMTTVLVNIFGLFSRKQNGKNIPSLSPKGSSVVTDTMTASLIESPIPFNVPVQELI